MKVKRLLANAYVSSNTDFTNDLSLELGATDYLVKPVRLQQCRALQNKMKRREFSQEEKSQLQGIAKYERLK